MEEFLDNLIKNSDTNEKQNFQILTSVLYNKKCI